MGKKNRRNYYRILHVQPEAPTSVIKAAYRTLMQKLKIHPDLGGDGELAALINEAYRVLKDPKARSQYDASLTAKSSAPRKTAPSEGDRATEAQTKSQSSALQARAFARMRKEGQVTFSHENSTVTYTGTLSDLSPEGLAFFTDAPLAVGEMLWFESQFVEGSGQITYIEAPPAGKAFNRIGMTFRSIYFKHQKGTFFHQKI